MTYDTTDFSITRESSKQLAELRFLLDEVYNAISHITASLKTLHRLEEVNNMLHAKIQINTEEWEYTKHALLTPTFQLEGCEESASLSEKKIKALINLVS